MKIMIAFRRAQYNLSDLITLASFIQLSVKLSYYKVKYTKYPTEAKLISNVQSDIHTFTQYRELNGFHGHCNKKNVKKLFNIS